jgi:hypothetical protein
VTLYRFRCPDCQGDVRWRDIEHGRCDDCDREFGDFRQLEIYVAATEEKSG